MKKLICVLLLLCVVGCSDLMYSDQLFIRKVTTASEKGFCLYTIKGFISDITLVDKCGLYTVGDRLVLSKMGDYIEEKEK